MVNVLYNDKMIITQTYTNGDIGTLELNKNQAKDLYKTLNKLFSDIVDTNKYFDICEHCKHEDNLEFEYPCNECVHLHCDSHFESKNR